MPIELSERLAEAAAKNRLPTVIAYNRIDGPGSSLDLREFQQALWRLPDDPINLDYSDESVEWSRSLPRTVGITIDTGTRIVALPAESGFLEYISTGFGQELRAPIGNVPPRKETWLLKILDMFGLSGIRIELHNLTAGTMSSGLGGSATATTGVCILANALAGNRFSKNQLVSLASRMEQDCGVSITGTQEQANVIYGGVRDYIWFPWGFPGIEDSNYGYSVRRALLEKKDYPALEERIAIFHTNQERPSSRVNAVWRDKLSENDGFRMHLLAPSLAYDFREGIRQKDWERILVAVRNYRRLRTRLCPDYMNGAKEIDEFSSQHGCESFPLGAGGGGGVAVFSVSPENLAAVRHALAPLNMQHREITFKIRDRGHDATNIPLQGD